MTHDRNILTVSQLTNAIKLCLEQTFPAIWVQGEVSNFKKQSSGHLYFSLKDTSSQISAVMFRGRAKDLPAVPKDGDKVLVKGEINVYPPSGRYQIIVNELKQIGVGELLLKLEELKKKIHKKGWFRQEHKKPIPKFPKRIGVVTSPTGAAIQDILNVLTRRFSGFSLLLNPVRVQGSEAPGEIAKAIKQFNTYDLVDVMIVGRGGGSIEDLWAFNEEIVAEAIFHSRIPIVAAVGHETDHCIAEYVADVRAPTPSAAAEIVMAEKMQQLSHLSQLEKRLNHTLAQTFRNCRQRLRGALRHPLFSTPYYLLGPWLQKLDTLRGDIDQSIIRKTEHFKRLLEERRKHAESLKPSAQIAHYRHQLSYWDKAANHAVKQQIAMKKERLMKVSATLQAIDPKKLLGKGYSILFSEKTGSVIKSVRQLEKNDDIRLLLADGEALSIIKEVIEK